jgi:hypothetical protein
MIGQCYKGKVFVLSVSPVKRQDGTLGQQLLPSTVLLNSPFLNNVPYLINAISYKEFSITHYIRYGTMIMTGDLKILWKEAVVAYFKALF